MTFYACFYASLSYFYFQYKWVVPSILFNINCPSLFLCSIRLFLCEALGASGGQESGDIFIVRRGHFTAVCPLDGHPRGHFIMFYPPSPPLSPLIPGARNFFVVKHFLHFWIKGVIWFKIYYQKFECTLLVKCELQGDLYERIWTHLLFLDEFLPVVFERENIHVEIIHQPEGAKHTTH